MYALFKLFLVPLLSDVIAAIIAEWLIRKYLDRRDKKQ